MSTLIFSMMVSLDGFVARPDGSLDWIMIDDELHSFANDQARNMDAFLYGRRMYQLMADYWPTADADPSALAVETEFARIWRSTPKIVFSQTLDAVDWNSRLVRTDLVDNVRALKAQPGGIIGVGGPTLAAPLIQHGLIDEFHLLIQPVVLGSGLPYFPPLNNTIHLRLVDTRTFGSGVVYLRYRLNAPTE